MSSENYLEGYIYHMVHFDNLENIFSQRYLLSKAQLERQEIDVYSIANEEVQNLRSRIFVLDTSTQKYQRLHTYVPFYFAKRTPMLWDKYTQGIQDDIVILEVNRSVLNLQGVLFTNGNATHQQLSKYGNERVGITPATIANPSCERIYRPSGPHGTNQRISEFYADVAFLRYLNWDGINQTKYIEDLGEYTHVRSAEVLIPDRLPLSRIMGIFVNTLNMADAVNKLIARYNFVRCVATYKSELFFR